MNKIRNEMNILAKANGLCTQCFINKATINRVQCQRCIDTNHKKQVKRRQSMKRIKGAVTVTQFFLKSQSIEKTLGELPKSFKIKELGWTGWNATSWKRLHIPESYKSIGVKSATEGSVRLKTFGTFIGMTRENMLKNAEKIINKFGIDRDHFWVEKLVLTDGTKDVYFKRMRKQIKDPSDKRKKITVLGNVGKNGANILGIMSDLSAGKVSCQYQDIPTRQIICSEVK